VAIKRSIREFCPTCGERTATLERNTHGEGRIREHDCSCPKPPGPPSPPRPPWSFRNAYLIRKDGTEIYEMPEDEAVDTVPADLETANELAAGLRDVPLDEIDDAVARVLKAWNIERRMGVTLEDLNTAYYILMTDPPYRMKVTYNAEATDDLKEAFADSADTLEVEIRLAELSSVAFELVRLADATGKIERPRAVADILKE
jgi:hypothetical protein